MVDISIINITMVGCLDFYVKDRVMNIHDLKKAVDKAIEDGATNYNVSTINRHFTFLREHSEEEIREAKIKELEKKLRELRDGK